MKKAIIKASFFVDTDIFQHVSQWEKAMMDFYAAHGADLERVNVLGAGDGNLFYTVTKMEMITPVAQPKKSEGLTSKLEQVKNQVNPSLKKNTRPLVSFKDDIRSKRTFNAGKPQTGKIRSISFNNQKPQGT